MENVSNFLTQSDMAVQKEALNYFESLKNDPSGWKLCISALMNQQDVNEPRVFFCLLVIENYVRTKYETDLPENQATLRQFVFNWFSSASYSPYILNKYALVVDTVFLADFPNQRWNTFFHDFLALCQTQKHCDLFLRILLQINADVADREIPRSPKENERNNLIKDTMRQTCLMELAQFWFNIINTYRESDPNLVCLCLEVIGAYVAWIDISLITNDCIMSNLFSLFEKNEYRCAVCDCFNSILHKGMDPIAKTQLIEQFMKVEAIKVKLQQMVTCADVNRNEEFLVKLSKLFNTIGLELIDSFKKIKPKQTVPAMNESIGAQLLYVASTIESKFELLCYFLGDKCDAVSLQVHPFTREYIQWIKNNKPDKSVVNLDEKSQEAITLLTKIIISKSKLAADCDFDADDDEENEDFRKSCKVLFDNIMLVNSAVCVNMICNELIQPVLNGWRGGGFTFAEVEVSLYFFYLMGENLNLIADPKRIEALLQLLISSSISSFPHPAVQSMYFELIIRYEKYFASNLNALIPQILISFLDERGLKSSNAKLRSRACQLFNRFIKCHIKSKASDRVQSFSEDILKRLEVFLKFDVLEMATAENAKSSIFDDMKYTLKEEDHLMIYETIATLIISNASYDIQKRYLLLRNVVKPVWDKFNECLKDVQNVTMNNAPIKLTNGNANLVSNDSRDEFLKDRCSKMSHCISLVTRTSKGFSNVNTIKSSNAQDIYLDSFNLFVKSLRLSVNEECLNMLQSAVRQLLHRLIVCFEETEIVPLLPVAIENVFLPSYNLNARTIQELVPLINQVVTKFKHSWLFQRDLLPFLKQMFLPLISSVFTLTTNPELAADEVQSVQKCYYSFLSIIASNNIIDVFTSLENSTFEQVLLTVVQGAAEHPDMSTQKSCFLILKKIIESYATNGVTNGNMNGSAPSEPKPTTQLVAMSPTFVEFIYKTVVPACFYAPLRQVEGDTSQLINECISCLRAIQTVRGSEEMSAYLQTRLFPEHFPTYSNANGFIESLAKNEVKTLRVHYKSLEEMFKKSILK